MLCTLQFQGLGIGMSPFWDSLLWALCVSEAGRPEGELCPSPVSHRPNVPPWTSCGSLWTMPGLFLNKHQYCQVYRVTKPLTWPWA